MYMINWCLLEKGSHRHACGLRSSVCVVPDLIGNLLLVLLLVAGTAAAEEEEGEKNENQQNADYYTCDDTSCVWGCKGPEKETLR